MSEFIPQNLLEELLVQATKDPAIRPKFIEILLSTNILVAPIGEPPKLENGIISTGTKIALAAVELQGINYTPFFSSESRIAPGTRYLQMATRDFFKLTSGAHLVLNPGTYGRTFVPSEIAAMLSGDYFRPTHTHVVQKPTQILIGQPAQYPKELASSLARLYAKSPAVRRAFLALYCDPKRDPESGLLIALDVDSDAAMSRLSAETGIVIAGAPKMHKFVDVIRFSSGEPCDYFVKNKIEPFYQRKFFTSVFSKFTG